MRDLVREEQGVLWKWGLVLFHIHYEGLIFRQRWHLWEKVGAGNDIPGGHLGSRHWWRAGGDDGRRQEMLGIGKLGRTGKIWASLAKEKQGENKTYGSRCWATVSKTIWEEQIKQINFKHLLSWVASLLRQVPNWSWILSTGLDATKYLSGYYLKDTTEFILRGRHHADAGLTLSALTEQNSSFYCHLWKSKKVVVVVYGDDVVVVVVAAVIIVVLGGHHPPGAGLIPSENAAPFPAISGRGTPLWGGLWPKDLSQSSLCASCPTHHNGSDGAC